MRPFIILQVIPIITSIKSLRKNKGINVGSFGDAPFITVMDPEPATPPETYTGVTVRCMYHTICHFLSTTLTQRHLNSTPARLQPIT